MELKAFVSRVGVVMVAAVGMALFAARAHALSVNLNAGDPCVVANSCSSVAEMHYRVSTGNWDQSISTRPALGPTTLPSTRDLGGHDFLNGRTYDFTVNFEAGSGYTFILTNGPASSTVRWTSPFAGASPLRSYNTIELFASAGPKMPSGIATAYVSVSNLVFSGPTSFGTLAGMRDNWDDFGSLTDRYDPDNVTRWLVANGDLSHVNWSLRGKVAAGFTYLPGFTSPLGGIDGTMLNFDVLAVNAPYAVPLPASVLLMLSGFMLIAVLPRRHRR